MPATTNRERSASYRSAKPDVFVKLQNGKFGGFKKGVENGPAPSTKRGKRRQLSRRQQPN